MTTDTVLTDGQIRVLFKSVSQEDYTKEGWVGRQRIAIGRAIEQAVLQSPEVQRLREWRSDMPPEELDRSPILAFNRRSREVEIVWGQLLHEVSDYSKWMPLPPPPQHDTK